MKKIPGSYKLDIFIIKKFLGTFFFAITLLMFITVIFDLSEKMDEFLNHKAPWSSIILKYYLNFIPYFAVLFAPLFTFISVIFFTSKMAYNTEIIAILSSGISFNRLLVPYFISATIIMLFNLFLGNYVIPHANQRRFDFEEAYYYNKPKSFADKNVHRQIEPGVFIYLERYNTRNDFGRLFSMEKFENGKLKSKLLSQDIYWDSTTNKWKVRNYMIRDYIDTTSIFQTGSVIDTTINMKPEDFKRRDNIGEAMNIDELNDFIEEQKLQGASNVDTFLIEKHRRFSFPFSTFILTLIGVSVSSRKVRGGMGMHIGLGVIISFTYLLFMQFSQQFAIGGNLSPMIAVWIPNILYGFIAYYLYKMAPK